mmetsp:Transcript_2448/g.5613  ORF Transcript_2448/g.5613 Transcript_2448/m.5613 type:complete len:256 (-) Transcript_2448:54-821(-)
MPRMAFLIFSSSSLSTRSILLRRTRSAKASCSWASFTTPSGLTSLRRARMNLASTTVMMPSSSHFMATSSSAKKVWATGAGSAMPVVSMMIASNSSLRARSFLTTTAKSLRTVQQMQPLSISIIWPSTFSLMRASSMPTSPNSFSMTANFLPCMAVRMCLVKVLLPDPRNPVRMVTGMRGPWSSSSSSSSSSPSSPSSSSSSFSLFTSSSFFTASASWSCCAISSTVSLAIFSWVSSLVAQNLLWSLSPTAVQVL